MNIQYNQATCEQLYTIAYHEPCSQAEKLMALMELNRRDKRAPGRMKKAQIKRKMA